MKAKISLDVMINDGRTFYGTVIGEIPLYKAGYSVDQFAKDTDITSLILTKFPTLKNKSYKIFINYVHTCTD